MEIRYRVDKEEPSKDTFCMQTEYLYTFDLVVNGERDTSLLVVVLASREVRQEREFKLSRSSSQVTKCWVATVDDVVSVLSIKVDQLNEGLRGYGARPRVRIWYRNQGRKDSKIWSSACSPVLIVR